MKIISSVITITFVLITITSKIHEGDYLLNIYYTSKDFNYSVLLIESREARVHRKMGTLLLSLGMINIHRIRAKRKNETRSIYVNLLPGTSTWYLYRYQVPLDSTVRY